jgi:hypothetical protein
MRRPLVVLCAGASSLHVANRWLSPSRAFELWIVAFEDGVATDGADRVFRCDGSKWDLIRAVAPEIRAADPEWVWLPDDDLAIDVEAVNAFFDRCNPEAWDLLQPALLPHNVSSQTLVQQHGGPAVRASDFVEIQMPCLSRAVLGRCLDFIEAEAWNKSGWGFDCVWSAWPGVRTGVVDAVAAHHTKPVDRTGGLYARTGINPAVEHALLLKKMMLN